MDDSIEMQAMQERVKDLETSLAAKRKLIAKLDAELAECKADKEHTVEECGLMVGQYNSERIKAQDDLAECKAEYADANSEIGSMLSEIKDLRARCEREETSVNELSLANQDLHQELDALRAELAAAKERNQILNPCGHDGYESAVCNVCGYPDPRKLIATLRARCERSEDALRNIMNNSESYQTVEVLVQQALEVPRE